MQLQRVLQYAQFLLQQTLTEGDIAVDATAGNGHDTLFLTTLVGDSGHIYAFDVQQEAITNTMARLAEAKVEQRATVILDGHEHVAKYVNERVKAAIFNLGYLPGAEHSLITQPSTTLEAIQTLLKKLLPGGLIILVVYHGHEGGKKERDAIVHYVSSLQQKYIHVLRYEFINQKNDPPFIIALEKMKDFPSKHLIPTNN